LKKLILDTSVCIDLYNGKLLEAVLQLPYKFVLPDVIIAELSVPPGKLLMQLGFTEENTSGAEIQIIAALRNKYLVPSFNDLLALLLAKRNACTLITGDNALRNAAKSEAVTIHGLLWLMDEMVKCDVLTGAQAADALDRIIAEGSWLPKKECEERLKKWRK
jgi:predicted nucleic acid-binding protein